MVEVYIPTMLLVISGADKHYNVGGAANTTRPSPEDLVRAREENKRIEQQARQRSKERAQSKDRFRGLADKGKDMLKKGSKTEEK